VRQDLVDRSAELRAARLPFVHAQVILAEAPTSAKPGDEAIVTGDGALIGFVGGSCAEATVRDQSLALLSDAGAEDTVVVRITPAAGEDVGGQSGKRVVHNPCLSGGTMEVFLERQVPPLLVVVAGRAPIAMALADLGGHVGFEMRPYEGAGHLPPDTAAVVVASHGTGEEDLLVMALEAGIPYVGLVASRRRGRVVVGSLPVHDELRARVHTPAGLDIGARAPEEVALSILAEIVATRPRPPAAAPSTDGSVEATDGSGARFATDPVCGMSVRVGPDAWHVRDEGGAEAWFCGRGCRDAYEADPASYQRG
jgi:xanthine dehydrogenase accessory factor